jgi:hypothetical protein
MYVEVQGWESLIHYRDRRPAWLKLEVSLLRDENYLRLTAHQRAVLHGIWLVYAETNGRVVASPAWLSRRLGFRVFRKTLDVLASGRKISIAVETGTLRASPQCGQGVEGFAGGDGLLTASRIEAVGGELSATGRAQRRRIGRGSLGAVRGR